MRHINFHSKYLQKFPNSIKNIENITFPFELWETPVAKCKWSFCKLQSEKLVKLSPCSKNYIHDIVRPKQKLLSDLSENNIYFIQKVIARNHQTALVMWSRSFADCRSWLTTDHFAIQDLAIPIRTDGVISRQERSGKLAWSLRMRCGLYVRVYLSLYPIDRAIRAALFYYRIITDCVAYRECGDDKAKLQNHMFTLGDRCFLSVLEVTQYLLV